MDRKRITERLSSNAGVFRSLLFLAERAESIRWLRGLETIDEAASYEHPVLGTLSAGDLLTSWLAHDLIHIRQMTRLHRQYLLEALSPHSAGYAGEW